MDIESPMKLKNKGCFVFIAKMYRPKLEMIEVINILKFDLLVRIKAKIILPKVSKIKKLDR